VRLDRRSSHERRGVVQPRLIVVVSAVIFGFFGGLAGASAAPAGKSALGSTPGPPPQPKGHPGELGTSSAGAGFRCGLPGAANKPFTCYPPGRPAQIILFMQNGTGQYADTVSKLELRTTIPAQLAIQSVRPRGGSCSTTAHTIHCDFGRLAAGTRVEAAITVVPSREGTYRFVAEWITDGACCITTGPSLMVRSGGVNHRF
jgi:hypothetical protein